MEITREEFENYAKTHMKLKLIYYNFIGRRPSIGEEITNMQLFGRVLTVTSEHSEYPEGHDSRSAFPQRVAKRVIIDLGEFIKE